MTTDKDRCEDGVCGTGDDWPSCFTTETRVEHTPGPWDIKRSDSSGRPTHVRTSQGADIVGLPVNHTTRDAIEANAHLIASAPDLLAALEEALEHIERTCRTAHHILSTDDCQSCAIPAFNARAAIERARGED